ncbi:MAG: hypothetical protein ACUVWO_12010 [Thermodesulfobacteriota bacterium]
MTCPLYQGPSSENPLKVCGPKDRIGFAPSSAHVKMFCLSISAYSECPNYKLKTKTWCEENWRARFFKQISHSFLERRKKRKGE